MVTVPQCGKALSYTVSYLLVTSLNTAQGVGERVFMFSSNNLATKRKWETLKVTKGFSICDKIQM
jgi:hypothetical protein